MTKTSDEVVLPNGRAWDLVVIGGGSAGLVASRTAAGLGADVLLIERDRTGGECLWTGCVPSKAFLSAAHRAFILKSKRQGVSASEIRIDFREVMRSVRSAIAAIEPEDSPETQREYGVRVAKGTARFTSPTSLDIDGHSVNFHYAVIATGSSPHLPSVPGLLEAGAVTSETLWDIDQLPQRLVVVGGGNIGVELGQAFQRLGSEVTIVQRGGRLLPREDQDVSALMADVLESEGVRLHFDAEVRNVELGSPHQVKLTNEETIDADLILIATGQRASLDALALDTAGVDTTPGGITTDEHSRTSNWRIFAAGDCTTNPHFTHTAGVHASVAASNAVLGLRRKVPLRNNPQVTYCQPEIASFGLSLDEAKERDFSTRTVHNSHVDRAIVEHETVGFTRLIFDNEDRLVGATIVSPRAGESLHELVLAANAGLKSKDIASTTHAYPTFNDGLWKASIEQFRESLNKPIVATAVKGLVRVRRFVSNIRR